MTLHKWDYPMNLAYISPGIPQFLKVLAIYNNLLKNFNKQFVVRGYFFLQKQTVVCSEIFDCDIDYFTLAIFFLIFEWLSKN